MKSFFEFLTGLAILAGLAVSAVLFAIWFLLVTLWPALLVGVLGYAVYKLATL